MKVLSVVGTRPNLVKIAPILRALETPVAPRPGDAAPLESILVDTGQHYDEALSANIFADLSIRAPDHCLAVGSGSHATMTADVMCRLEPILIAERPDVVLVVGDTNSTMAATVTAAKLHVRVAHVEAGLRSFDRSMPEEINRLVTDALADFLFTTEASATDNLRREGHTPETIDFVGNVMVDSLCWARPRVAASTIFERLRLRRGDPFAVLTVHRSGNVDRPETLRSILEAAAALARDVPVILPAHPRTRARIAAFGLMSFVQPADPDGAVAAPGAGRVRMLGPLPYLDCIALMAGANLVLTDSGGVQDETTALGVPCVTLRGNTERPVTLTAGTNVLAGTDVDRIVACARAALHTGRREIRQPPLWDGHAAERIVRVLADRL